MAKKKMFDSEVVQRIEGKRVVLKSVKGEVGLYTIPGFVDKPMSYEEAIAKAKELSAKGLIMDRDTLTKEESRRVKSRAKDAFPPIVIKVQKEVARIKKLDVNHVKTKPAGENRYEFFNTLGVTLAVFDATNGRLMMYDRKPKVRR